MTTTLKSIDLVDFTTLKTLIATYRNELMNPSTPNEKRKDAFEKYDKCINVDTHIFAGKLTQFVTGDQITALFMQFKNIIKNDFDKIDKMFDEKGELKEEYTQLMTALLFNDDYKISMNPVIHHLELYCAGLMTKFGVFIRDEESKMRIKNCQSLREEIYEAIKKLCNRVYDPTDFNKLLKLKNRENIISKIPSGSLLNKILPYGDDFSSTDYSGTDAVASVRFDEPNGSILHIEAIAPASLASGLETTIMQAVYDVLDKHKLREKAKKENKTFQQVYAETIDDSKLDCFRSIILDYIFHELCEGKSVSGAIFAGRRTSLHDLLIHNMMIGHLYLQAVPNGSPYPVPNSIHDSKYVPTDATELASFKANMKLKPILGTSASQVYLILTQMNLPCVIPVGTHGHEMQMIAAGVFAHLDQQTGIPISQTIAHALFYQKVCKKSPTPMIALTDTYLSKAFFRMLKNVTLNKVPLVNIISSFRQDSGKMHDYVDIMRESGIEKPVMASEIDSVYSLLLANLLDEYKSFGAGGFFGKSSKVYRNGTNPSIATKVIEVRFNKHADVDISIYEQIPNAKIDGNTIIYYPIKCGDPDSYASNGMPIRSSTSMTKLSISKALSPIEQQKIVQWVDNLCINAITTNYVYELTNICNIFDNN